MSRKTKDPTVPCPECGYENPIFSVFCKGCSNRLYKGDAKPAASKRSRKTSKIRAVGNFAASVVLLAFFSACGFALWPISPTDIPTAAAQNSRVKIFLSDVQEVKERGGIHPDTKISQTSLNAFLGQHVDPDEKKYLGATLSEERIRIMASVPLGPLHIGSRLELYPKEGGAASFVPSRLSVGLLPLPVSLAPQWAERMIDTFDLDVEAGVLQDLRIRKVFDNGMVIGMDPS